MKFRRVSFGLPAFEGRVGIFSTGLAGFVGLAGTTTATGSMSSLAFFPAFICASISLTGGRSPAGIFAAAFFGVFLLAPPAEGAAAAVPDPPRIMSSGLPPDAAGFAGAGVAAPPAFAARIMSRGLPPVAGGLAGAEAAAAPRIMSSGLPPVAAGFTGAAASTGAVAACGSSAGDDSAVGSGEPPSPDSRIIRMMSAVLGLSAMILFQIPR